MATQSTETTIKVGDIYRTTGGYFHKIVEIGGSKVTSDYFPTSVVRANRAYYKLETFKDAIRRGVLYKSTPEKLALFLVTGINRH